MGIKDDEEAAVLIEKLWKWNRLLTMLEIVCVVMFIVVVNVGYDISRLEFFIFIGVLATLINLHFKKVRCPFCQENIFWPYRSGGRSGRSGMWRYVYSNLIPPKKCPHCCRSLRVKKKKGTATIQK